MCFYFITTYKKELVVFIFVDLYVWFHRFRFSIKIYLCVFLCVFVNINTNWPVDCLTLYHKIYLFSKILPVFYVQFKCTPLIFHCLTSFFVLLSFFVLWFGVPCCFFGFLAFIFLLALPNCSSVQNNAFSVFFLVFFSRKNLSQINQITCLFLAIFFSLISTFVYTWIHISPIFANSFLSNTSLMKKKIEKIVKTL